MAFKPFSGEQELELARRALPRRVHHLRQDPPEPKVRGLRSIW
jgi:hypothetical protein